MSVDAVILFLSLLTVAAQLAVAGVLVLAMAGRSHVLDDLRASASSLAFVVATVATLGSLYFSEVAHFIPCKLCWYQRGFMYPLVAVLAIAAWRGWSKAWRLVVPWCLAGATISVWHMLIERYPTLETSACDPDNPCSLIWFERFGYITIPTMALSGFLLIATLMFLGRRPALDKAR